MKNIIIIADGTTSDMLQKSINPDVNVLLYLEFQNYWALNAQNRLLEKESFIEQMLNFSKHSQIQPDYIFSFIKRIDIISEELCDWVLDALNMLEYPSAKIIDGYRIYRSLFPRERYVRKLSNPKLHQLDGVVFGLSHAEAGILTDFLPGCACNFASLSQDIYFNYYTAKQIWATYPDKVQNLNYIVIDMFDYFYFNFETIFSGAALNFFEHSGLSCPNGFDITLSTGAKASSSEINDYLKNKWPHSTPEERLLLFDYFNHLIEHDENAYDIRYLIDGQYILTQEDITRYLENPPIASVQSRVFEHSITKNIQYFFDFLSFLHTNNPNAKIILCLLPKYKVVEDYESAHLGRWKPLFENIILNFQQKIPFIYLNYKYDEEISTNAEYYADMTHLNINGAHAFTKKLTADILKILNPTS